jgi:hypothetical protein
MACPPHAVAALHGRLLAYLADPEGNMVVLAAAG